MIKKRKHEVFHLLNGISVAVIYFVSMTLASVWMPIHSPTNYESAGWISLALIVHLAFMSSVICYLVNQLRLSRFRLLGAVVCIVAGYQTVSTQLETLLNLSLYPLFVPTDIYRLTFREILVTTITVAIAMMLYSKWRTRLPVRSNIRGGWLRWTLFFGLSAFCYLILYYLVGSFMLKYSKALWSFHTYTPEQLSYSNHLSEFIAQSRKQIAFEFLRGVLFTVFALPFLLNLKKNHIKRIAIGAVLFALLPTVQLLYPNPVIPDMVRAMLFIEISVSNTIFAVIFIWLFDILISKDNQSVRQRNIVDINKTKNSFV